MPDALDLLLGESRGIAELRTAVRRLAERARAASPPPSVLVLGETGTGKGLLAGLLHRIGPRAGGPFVDLNCASIPAALLESELFGHERGAFTGAEASRPGMFQAAHRGTLFLDEIGLLSLPLQAKLLKAVEERAVRRLGSTRPEAVDVWIVSATNEDLRQAVRQGRFREDLYHRLAVVTLTLPPLRERGGDAVLLARQFLRRAGEEFGLGRPQLTPAAEARIAAHPWPGNVRELANAIDRAVLLGESSLIDEDGLDLDPGRADRAGGPAPPASPPRAAPPEPPDAPVTLEDSLRAHLRATLESHGGNITRAALALGIARNTLRAHIARLGLRVGPGPGSRAPGRSPGRDSRIPPSLAGLLAASRGAPQGETDEPVAGDHVSGPDRAAAAGAGAAGTETTFEEGAGPLRWERRLVAVLAIEITPPAGQSPFHLAPRLQELLTLVRRFGGRVEALTPLRLVAAFGLDAREDGPRRAAAAALAATTLLGRTPGGPAGKAAVEVAEHVVSVGDSVTGMDLAARQALGAVLDGLLARAAAGEALVTDGAAPHLARDFELHERGPDAGAGLAIRRPGSRGRSGPGLRGRRLSPFVGRGHELAALQGIVASAAAGGGSQVVGVVGEPGVGKSRLLHELRASLPSGRALCLVGRCGAPGPPIPYLPILEALRAGVGIRERDGAETAARRLTRALRAAGLEAEGAVPSLLHFLGWPGWPADTGPVARPGPEALRARTVEALRALGRAASRRQPLILMIEDLQWVDPSSLDCLTALLDGLRDSAVVVMATYRPGFALPWLGRSNVHQMALRRLGRAESLAVLGALLPPALQATDLPDRLAEQADGVPFYLEELARAAAGHPGATELRVPDTIQGLLAARLDQVGLARRRLLQAAAVIGREFPVAILEAVAGGDPAAAGADLAALRAAGFVLPGDSGPDETLRFAHALTHEVAYRTLLDPDRRALHARVADALERLAPEVVRRRPERLARHAAEGGRPRDAAGYWRQAGRLAIERSAHAEAVAQLKAGLDQARALDPGPERDREELLLLLDLGTVLIARLGYGAPEVEALLGQARRLADRLEGAIELFPVRWALWRFALSRADYATARELARQLLESAASPDRDASPAVAARVAAGVTAFYLGDLEAALGHLGQARDLHDPARARDHLAAYGQDLGSVALGFLGWAEAITGRLDRAVLTVAQAQVQARALGHPFSLGLVLYLAAQVAQLRGARAELAALGRELLALADAHAYRLFRAFGLMVSGWAEQAAGHRERAMALTREGADLFHAVGQRAGLAHRVHLAAILLEGGALDEARAVVDEARERAEATAEGAFRSEIERLRAELLERRGRAAEAEATLGQALAHARGQGAWLFALRAALSLAARAGAAPLEAQARARLAEALTRVAATDAVEEIRRAQRLMAPATTPMPTR